ncbi:ubiquitin-associated domain-containing protein 2-like [Limulus polyphemus]|uniref:Ubiquitin-associated domain-containing protein 2-like n=1 Tax=Limulus polyphemus TaxID=6850 RepID=A0ABM1TNM4_LIMPO|nr:ubiquitin-associated domain-containing protein 2-like [Limulus polyphemus]
MAAILSHYSTIGFYKAPVSKGLLGCMFITSLALNVPLLAHIKQFVVYNVSDIFDKYEVWRVITSKICFLDTKDLVCGSLLIYYFRIFERRYGSHKFSSYLLATFTLATLLELASVFILRKLEFHVTTLPSGPFGLVFPLFVNYYTDFPRVAHVYIMGVPVTGKTMSYLLGLQVLANNTEVSMMRHMCSHLAGLICRWNLLRITDFIYVPKFLAHFAKITLGWLLKSAPPQEGVIPMGATLDIQRQQQLELLEQQRILSRAREIRENGQIQARQQMAQGYAERLVPASTQDSRLFPSSSSREVWENVFNLRRRRIGAEHENQWNMAGSSLESHGTIQPNDVTPVVEEKVQKLVEMGFERQSAVRALETSNNDLNAATTILLNET